MKDGRRLSEDEEIRDERHQDCERHCRPPPLSNSAIDREQKRRRADVAIVLPENRRPDVRVVRDVAVEVRQQEREDVRQPVREASRPHPAERLGAVRHFSELEQREEYDRACRRTERRRDADAAQHRQPRRQRSETPSIDKRTEQRKGCVHQRADVRRLREAGEHLFHRLLYKDLQAGLPGEK